MLETAHTLLVFIILGIPNDKTHTEHVLLFAWRFLCGLRSPFCFRRRVTWRL